MKCILFDLAEPDISKMVSHNKFQSFISFNINLNSERIDAVTPHTFRPSKL